MVGAVEERGRELCKCDSGREPSEQRKAEKA
jgi:hypothetical protein